MKKTKNSATLDSKYCHENVADSGIKHTKPNIDLIEAL